MEHTHHTQRLSRFLSLLMKNDEGTEDDRLRQKVRRDRLSACWRELQVMLAGEIATMNMLLKLHKLERAFDACEHPICDAQYVGRVDIVVGTSFVRVSACARSGELVIEHYDDGIPSFDCKRLRLCCMTATRHDLQEMLGILLRSSFPSKRLEESQ